jgi:hypothetical protein
MHICHYNFMVKIPLKWIYYVHSESVWTLNRQSESYSIWAPQTKQIYYLDIYKITWGFLLRPVSIIKQLKHQVDVRRSPSAMSTSPNPTSEIASETTSSPPHRRAPSTTATLESDRVTLSRWAQCPMGQRRRWTSRCRWSCCSRDSWLSSRHFIDSEKDHDESDARADHA